MLRKAMVLGVLFGVVATMAACGSEDGGNGDRTNAKTVTSGENAGVTLNVDYDDALPVPSQLAIGTLMLEDTENAVTAEQAGDLLPSWKMLQALQNSDTAAQVEVDAVLNQIQGAMTDEQLLAIKEMKLTPASMTELAQERGLGFGGGTGTDEEGGRGFRPEGAFIFGGGPGGGPGGGMGPGGAFGGQNVNPDEMQADVADRMNRFLGAAVGNMVVSMLEARAEGKTWEVAAPDPNFGLQRTLFSDIADAAGIDQQSMMEQLREGKSLLEIIEASGTELDVIVGQVVNAETERIGQAVTDGSITQADADEWLAGLEPRIRDMLEGTFQFGGRGAPGAGTDQP
jgi:hypothetical protein